MKSGKTTKTCYYRRFKIETNPSFTLQQLLGQGLGKEPKVEGRLEAIDTGASHFRVIGHSATVNGFLCGALLTFERGSYQTVISDDPQATTISMESLAPPVKNDVQQQYVPGALYFSIFENHVAIVQSPALRANAFEQYLAWFLRSKTNVIAPSVPFVLSDEPQKVTQERIRASHVKAIAFNQPFMDEFKSQVPAIGYSAKAPPVTKFTANPSVLALLKSYLSSDDLTNLGLERGVFDGNLEVWLEIRYPTRQRSHPVESMKLMDNLSIALRNHDEDAVELLLNDNTRIKGKDLKISAPLDAKMIDGLIDESDLFQQMTAWVSKLISDRMVSS